MQVGGHIRDKMWWFGSYQYRRDYFSEPGTDPALPTQDLQDRVFGKLTWQVNQDNNVLFAYHNDHWRLPDTITPSYPRDAASMGRGHIPTFTATWRRVLNDNTTFDCATAALQLEQHARSDRRPDHAGRLRQITDEYSVNYRDYSWSNWRLTPPASARGHPVPESARPGHDVRFGLPFTDGGTQASRSGRRAARSRYATALPATRRPRSQHLAASPRVRRICGRLLGDDDRITLNAGVRFDLNTGDIRRSGPGRARNEVGTAEAVQDLVELKTFSPAAARRQLKLREAAPMRAATPLLSGLPTNLFSALSLPRRSRAASATTP